MPRRNNPRRSNGVPGASRTTGVPAWATTERTPDGEWLVRRVPGSQAVKSYRCPGCDHEVRPGTPHVVAWPAGEHGTSDARRHWHTGCWQARDRRAPTRR